MRRAPGQRSLADMANEQLNAGKYRDKLAEGMAGAATPDCLRPSGEKEVLTGLLAAPLIAQRALHENCTCTPPPPLLPPPLRKLSNPLCLIPTVVHLHGSSR